MTTTRVWSTRGGSGGPLPEKVAAPLAPPEISLAFGKETQAATSARKRRCSYRCWHVTGGDLSERSILQMLTQHARIRGLAMQLSDELKQDEIREDTLRNLGEQLEAHIRLEERQVFPLIEETLPEHALQEVSSRLDVFEPGPPHERWVPAEGFSFDPWPGPGDSEGGGSD